MSSKETVADFNIKLNATKRRAEDVALEIDGLQARLQQSLRGQNKVGESIICVQSKIDRFSAGLKEGLNYMKR